MNKSGWEVHWTGKKRDPLAHIESPVEYADISWRVFLKRLKLLIQNKGFEKILEVGAGSGICTRYLMTYGYDVTAIDSSPTAVELLNRSVGNDDGKPIANCIDLYELKAKEEYDLIISSGVKEFLPDLGTALKIEWDALREGGCLLFVMVPRRFSIQTIGDVQRKIAHSLRKLLKPEQSALMFSPAIPYSYRIRTYTEKELKLMMENSGFRNVVVRYRTPFPNIALSGRFKRLYLRCLINNEDFWLKFGDRQNFLSKTFGVAVEVYGEK